MLQAPGPRACHARYGSCVGAAAASGLAAASVAFYRAKAPAPARSRMKYPHISFCCSTDGAFVPNGLRISCRPSRLLRPRKGSTRPQHIVAWPVGSWRAFSVLALAAAPLAPLAPRRHRENAISLCGAGRNSIGVRAGHNWAQREPLTAVVTARGAPSIGGYLDTNHVSPGYDGDPVRRGGFRCCKARTAAITWVKDSV